MLIARDRSERLPALERYEFHHQLCARRANISSTRVGDCGYSTSPLRKALHYTNSLACTSRFLECTREHPRVRSNVSRTR